MASSILVSFIIAALIGPYVIKVVKKLGMGQTERNVGAVVHLEKEGTPIMGGFIFIISTLLVSCIYYIFFKDKVDLLNLFLLSMSMISFSIIGFLDDYIKGKKERNLGLNEKQKLVLQFAFAFLLAFYQFKKSDSLMLPFIGGEISLGLFFTPFIMVVIVGTVNSANLLDGLDGLASSVSVFFFVFTAYVGYKQGLGEVVIFSLALIGGLLGFLLYNKYPAKIFMGDTGSMAIGGAIAGLCLLTESSLFIPIAGFIYLFEALSVILQVWYYKKHKKRIFLMSPIHYHFQKKWDNEKKVVLFFVIIQIMTSILGIIGYKG
ncbi:MAG: phospho-N-acetylmuramoyl-pentapeptide-transferase [Tissierellia bacterium]|nr:phospho-N-acetylmuramoyl-pentapeptide-transferase [Tissierellia bacterium]